MMLNRVLNIKIRLIKFGKKFKFLNKVSQISKNFHDICVLTYSKKICHFCLNVRINLKITNICYLFSFITVLVSKITFDYEISITKSSSKMLSKMAGIFNLIGHHFLKNSSHSRYIFIESIVIFDKNSKFFIDCKKSYVYYKLIAKIV